MDVWIEDRPAIATAVIEGVPWQQALDEIWAWVRAEGLQAGRNVMRYGDRSEAGVELAAFAPSGRIVASSLPAGPTVVARRRGTLSAAGIEEAHAAARAWAAREGHALTGTCWEIYGHMSADPDAFELLVGWLLAQPE